MQTVKIKNVEGHHSWEPAYAVNLFPGQKIIIKLSKCFQRHKTHIVGVEKYKYAICRLPVFPGVKPALDAGSGLTVRFEDSGTVYGFHGKVMHHLITPSPMLIFTYPNRVETVKLRRHRRIKCLIPCKVSANNTSAAGFISDISEGGCKVVFVNGERESAKNLVLFSDAVSLKFVSEVFDELCCAAKLVSLGHRNNSIECSFSFQMKETPRELKRFLSSMSVVYMECNSTSPTQ